MQVKKTLLGVFNRIGAHYLSLAAAGVAFYAFLSVFPAIATSISIYGLVADASTVRENIQAITGFMPPEVSELLFSRMKDIANNQDASLTLGLIIGILLSLWSANRAMKAIAQGLNIAYEKEEDRNIIQINLVTLALTLVSAVVAIFVFSTTVILPIIINYFLAQESAKFITTLATWLIFIAVIIGFFLLLYRYAPARHSRPAIKDSLPGAILSTFLILLASVLFSFYVANFSEYDKQYGAISAVVVTLLWLFLGAFIFLLGAELNAERLKNRTD